MWLRNRLMDEAGGTGAAGTGSGGTKEDAAGAGAAAGADAGKGAGGAGGAAAGADAGKGDAGAGAGAGTGDAGKGAGDEGKGYWPADWVSKVSKGDEKALKQLSRYASPEALAEAHLELRKRMDSGQFVSKLAPDAKPEQIAQWRKDNGLPEAPDKYDLTGIEIKPEDKTVIDSFLKSAHAANMTPQQVKAAIEWRQAENKTILDAQKEADETQKRETLDALSKEFGAEWPANRTRVENFLNLMPEKARAALMGGRTATGKAFFNDAEIVRGLISIERMLNPAGVVVPAGGGDMVKGVVEEYQGIQKVMREKRGEYNKDEGMRSRFRELTNHLLAQGKIDANGNLIQEKGAEQGRKAA